MQSRINTEYNDITGGDIMMKTRKKEKCAHKRLVKSRKSTQNTNKNVQIYSNENLGQIY